MWKKSIGIGAAGVLLAALLLLFAIPGTHLAAAGANILYYGSAAAEEGQLVDVVIELSGDVVFTTLGLRLNYDGGKLLYEGEQWTPELQSQGTVMTLISDVGQGGGKALNISIISNNGYQGNGTMLILRFRVKKSYTENPFLLELREITDNNMQSISDITEIKYQNTGEEPPPEPAEPTLTPEPAEPTLTPEPAEPTPTPKPEEPTPPPEPAEPTPMPEPAEPIPTPEPEKSTPPLEPAEPTPVPSPDNLLPASVPGDSGLGTGGGGMDNASNISHPSIFQTGLEISGTGILCLGGLFVLVGVLCIAVRRKLS